MLAFAGMMKAWGCRPRYARMACLNHWIPVFAGMTTGAAVWHLSGMAKGLSGWQVLPNSASGYRSYGHPRFTGMACVPHWIPACAGMTGGL